MAGDPQVGGLVVTAVTVGGLVVTAVERERSDHPERPVRRGGPG